MKKIFGWLHLWLGIASGIVVLVVAGTGSLLVFEEELEHVFQSSFFYVEVPANTSRQPLDNLTAYVQRENPKYRVGNILVEPEADRSVVYLLRKGKGNKVLKNQLYVAVNPYTGKIIESIPGNKRFFSVVLQLHRYLCIGETGKFITGISCSIFTILILTGLILWWPKRNNRKQRLSVKWNASFKRLNWDLHAVFGFYVHIILLIIALTGLVWSYKWMNNLLYIAFDGNTKQQKIVPPASLAVKNTGIAYLEKIVNTTNTRLPYEGAITIRFAENDSTSIAASKENRARHGNVSDFLYFQAGTGELIKERLYDNESNGTIARRWVYPLHRGTLYGWPTQILALIAALVATTLPISGFLIWMGRKKKKKKPELKAKAVKPQALPLDKHSNTSVQYQ
ncbi:PepSY domain-containing protein [Chitinophaga filiformis]|uniref:PepSY-associated TM helix domain-containing protein n=1 Tax=Chitinophaga filiformis TaxID=104663 RepID=UPI001F231737|nr:PepSY-associated TM helix domain-containing protein [Chitinophaga filiformis]MCF6401401.1 PepSY domain-containing protein [Chitinophaga filiformis]